VVQYVPLICVQTEAKHKREVTTTNLMEEKLQNEATPFTDCIVPKSKCRNELVDVFEIIIDASTKRK
jgi:hypothetical protein